MTDYFQVGVITQTHGLKGEVKVFPTTDDPSRFSELKEVLLFPPEDRWQEAAAGRRAGQETAEAPLKALTIERARYFKQFVILKFKGLDRIEDVERLTRSRLCVTRENASPLGENEYYIADLLDMEARDEEGKVLGVISDVLSTGANDVYVVKGPDREILIPAIRDCILKVDTEGRRMVVRLLKGL